MLNIPGITAVLTGLVGVVVIIAALSLLTRAHSRNFGAVIGSLGVVLIGLMVYAMRNDIPGLSGSLFHTIFKG